MDKHLERNTLVANIIEILMKEVELCTSCRCQGWEKGHKFQYFFVLQPEEGIQQAWLSGVAIQSQEGICLFVPNSALLKCATGRGL